MGTVWRTRLRRGLEALAAGEFAAAIEQFELAYTIAPEQPEVCYALGRERMRSRRLDDAADLLRAAWVGDRSLVSAAATLARCLGLLMEQFDDAHAVLDDAFGDADLTADCRGLLHVVRAELFLAQNRYDDARDAAQAAFGDLPRDGDDSDDSDDSEPADATRLDLVARESVRAAAAAALARVHNHAGIEAVDRGERDMALFLFKRAAHLDPGWSSPLVNMGTLLSGMGKLDRARKAYRDAIRAEPENAVAHLNHGLLLRDAREADSALEALHRAVELDPGLSDAAVALADIYIERGEPDAAVRALARAVEHHPDDPSLWTRLGVAFAEAGRRNDAEASLRQALDIDPRCVRACAHLADLLARDGRYIEATVLARRAQALTAETEPHPEKRP